MEFVKINNIDELVEVIATLDCVEFIPAQIGSHTMDLYYDPTLDCYGMFDKCNLTFETADDMEQYITFEYGLH